jgi:tRNA dimethylallyltransferase
MKQLLVIIGPTASGKTDLGIRLAQKYSTCVISADSRQVYAGMNIGTAKPAEIWSAQPHNSLTAEKIQNVDHYLFNIASPASPIYLPQWQQAAQTLISQLHERHDVVVLVGGTMLYVDSIVQGFTIPEATPNKALRGELEQLDTGMLYSRLITQDPAASDFIEPHHKQRIIRALEVIQATGQPFSVQRKAIPTSYASRMIGLFPGWNTLEQRIIQRIEHMLAKGLVEETKQLQATYGSDLPLLATINYAQAGHIIRGELSVEEAKKKMIQANMRYARRQMSWWRRNKQIEWFIDSAEVE